jgi:T5SS/PEP-CTERM-associated repeat protein
MNVGYHSNATLDILAGGQVISEDEANVAYDAGTSGIVNVDGVGSEWQVGSDLIVGLNGIGTLNITNGGRASSPRGVVGSESGSVGEVTVDGTGSKWTTTNASGLSIGYLGTGTLTIQNSGTVEAGGNLSINNLSAVNLGSGLLKVGSISGGTNLNWTGGTLQLTASVFTVDAGGTLGDVVAVGAGKVLQADGGLYVGNAGNGTLDIVDGGQVAGQAPSYVGNSSGSTGQVTVDGMGSVFNWGVLLHVGHAGIGTVQITNGGLASGGGDLVIGELSGSLGTVSVDGANSRLTTSNMYVGGMAGDGELQITDGAIVESIADTQVAVGFGGMGTVTIDGTNSRWDVPGVLYVGKLTGQGEGTIYVTNGGWLNSQFTGFGILGRETGTTGNVIIQGAGSKWTATGGIGYVRVGDAGAGSLTVEDGGTVETANVYIGLLGELRGNGNVIADMENQGLVSPGSSAGALNIDGDYIQTADGELLIELASATSYDQLLADSATLHGTLRVELLDDFIPSVGQSFTILSAGVNNEFVTEILPVVPGRFFDVIYNQTNVLLQVLAAALPGDYNGDGAVDAADYVVWRKTDGSQEGYDTWRANFGATAGSGAGGAYPANAAVPEPTCFALLFLAAITALLHQRCGLALAWG